MTPPTRSRIVGLLIFLAVIAAIREVSIRRHVDDLHAWPGGHDLDLRPS